MKFAVYKLNFAAGVHLGTGTLASGANTVPGRCPVFSAVHGSGAAGEKSIKTLVDAVRQNRLRIGDLFSVYRRGTLPAEPARAGSKGKTRAIRS